MMIALGENARLFAVTAAGALVALTSTACGVVLGGLAGAAAGASVAFGLTFFALQACALGSENAQAEWTRHFGRLAAILGLGGLMAALGALWM
jgi:hypothetical protein